MSNKVCLDIGCGKNKKEGYIGVDKIPFSGVDVIADVSKEEWPWKDESVDEIHCSHVIEHLEAKERIFFVNEAYRVLKTGGIMVLVVPHWSSCRAYGDLTHKWPPVSEFWFYYLLRSWREQNAPHNVEYTCNFDVTWGYTLHNALIARNVEYQQYAMQWFKEAIADIVATCKKV